MLELCLTFGVEMAIASQLWQNMHLYNGISWEIARINKSLEIPITSLDKHDLKEALKAIKAIEKYQTQEQNSLDAKKKDGQPSKPATRGFPRV